MDDSELSGSVFNTVSLLDVAVLNDPELARREADRVYRNFATMTVCYSMTLGCVTTVVSYAAAEFSAVGNYSNATLYGTYCISGLFIGNIVVSVLGLKLSLVCGVAQYCVYLLMYLSAFFIGKDSPIANGFVLTGAAIGGLGSGYLWTAQGAYFQQCAKRYAHFSGKTNEAATGELSSLFSATFLFFETSLKLIGGAIQSQSAMAMYLVFSCIGFTAVIGMSTIENVSPQTKEGLTCGSALKNGGRALELLATDPKVPPFTKIAPEQSV
jgi:hypothetical protein